MSDAVSMRLPSLDSPRPSAVGLAVVVVLHIAVFWLLLRMEIISVPVSLTTLTVNLIAPPEEVKAPEPEMPKPRPVEKRPEPVKEPIQLAAPEESPASPSAPTIEAPPPVEFTPSPVVVEVVQPRFDADYLDNPKPPYPALSRRMGEEGRVILRVLVQPNGAPSEVVLHRSSGASRLDQAALDTVRRWKFVPARRGSEAVAAWVLVPIVFSLKE